MTDGGLVVLEAGVCAAVRADLLARGHKLAKVRERTLLLLRTHSFVCPLSDRTVLPRCSECTYPDTDFLIAGSVLVHSDCRHVVTGAWNLLAVID